MRKPRRTILHPKGEVKIIEVPVLAPGSQVTLDSFLGIHVLDAVDTFTEKQKRYDWSDELEDCEHIRFRLGGISYVAIEDPDDGYRSMMKHILVSDIPMVNVFPPIRVQGRKRNNDDIIEFIDVETRKVVLEIGTDHSDDYYPSFVGSFHPENMTTNRFAPIVKLTGKRKVKL